ncbi:MAG: glycosyltransferase [Chthoniobacteraceae bacterium]
MISDYISQGGAAIACNRLAGALAAQGDEVRRFALERGTRQGSPPTRVTFAPEPYGRRAGALIELAKAFEFPKASRFLRIREAEKRLLGAIAEWQPDIVNVHNLHAFSPHFLLVPKLAKLAPIAWTLHDMWSFTGRCAYNDDCRQFETSCTASCPTAEEYPALPCEAVPGEWQERARFFAATPGIAAVTPSRWLAAEARRGLWRDHRVEVIANSLDLHLHRPIERSVARSVLGLPPSSRPHVLLAADYLDERRKGGSLVGPALAACGREITLLTLGNRAPASLPENVQSVHLGYISDERAKALAYSAADLLLHPAPTDNLPNTVVEALACGTPVIAFRTGGLPDMVHPPTTGWLVETLSSAALGGMLSRALDQPFPAREAIRAFAEASYAPSKQAAAYRELFDDLITSRDVCARN